MKVSEYVEEEQETGAVFRGCGAPSAQKLRGGSGLRKESAGRGSLLPADNLKS